MNKFTNLSGMQDPIRVLGYNLSERCYSKGTMFGVQYVLRANRIVRHRMQAKLKVQYQIITNVHVALRDRGKSVTGRLPRRKEHIKRRKCY
jgi:hypothetical protein